VTAKVVGTDNNQLKAAAEEMAVGTLTMTAVVETSTTTIN
jgi:hypothetical protein